MTTNGIGNAWVANELKYVGQAKIPFKLHSMRPSDAVYYDSPWALELNRNTSVLYPLRPTVLALSLLLSPFLFGKKFFAALLNAFFGKRESFRVRCAGIAHLIVACYWARQLVPNEVSLIHSQWIHSCGTISMYAAWLLGKPFSFTGHAADLFRERCALEDKVRRACRIICISEFHREFYRKLGVPDEKLIVAYCGIDVSHFSPAECRPPRVILSSGRLVEKKGFNYLIDACRLLREKGIAFRCFIAGSGPLMSSLKARIAQAQLDELVTLTGTAIKQEEIPEFMHGGTVYCLPCVWAKDNDVDGLPQMLMEAMACGLPVISTNLVGIPDLIVHGETGLLVSPNNSQELADALNRLLSEPQLAERLAARGREHVVAKFSLPTSLEPLFSHFNNYLRISTSAINSASMPAVK